MQHAATPSIGAVASIARRSVSLLARRGRSRAAYVRRLLWAVPTLLVLAAVVLGLLPHWVRSAVGLALWASGLLWVFRRPRRR